MNVVGIGLASATGLLAVYLWLGQNERVTTKQDEASAEMRCQRAEFDRDMAGKWNESPERLAKLGQRVETECGRFEAKRTESEITRVVRDADAKEMKDAIGSLMK